MDQLRIALKLINKLIASRKRAKIGRPGFFPDFLPSRFFFPVVLAACPLAKIHAASPSTPGPEIDAEVAPDSTTVQESVGTGDNSAKKTWKSHYNRVHFNALAPIPARLLGGIGILEVEGSDEQRQESGSEFLTQAARHPKSLAAGFIFMHHAPEGAPEWFGRLLRYGIKGKPMTEAIIGVNLSKHPWTLKFSENDLTETRVLFRHRQFPYAQRWLLVAEHSIYTPSGYFLSAGIPSHLLFGWQSPDFLVSAETGLRLASRDYSLDISDTYASSEDTHMLGDWGWSEGRVAQAYVSARRQIFGIHFLYIGIEAGFMMRHEDFYLENGRRVATTDSSEPFPYVVASLSTHFITP